MQIKKTVSNTPFKTMMHIACATLAVATLSTATACAVPDSAEFDEVMSWEEFRDQATFTVDDQEIYIVDWDIAVTLEQLERRYERYLDSQYGDVPRSTVNDHDGEPDIWSAADRLNLSYCVTDSFGDEKDRMVTEMANAAAAWELAADLDFKYVPAEDSNCQAANPNVLFAVRPWANGGGCAFFPSGMGCLSHTLFIDLDDLDNNPSWDKSAPNISSEGVLRHELGHILGLRHEHTRPESKACFEDSTWTEVTPYDVSSVMHYQWCNGITESDMSLTADDRLGVELLYGPAINPTAAAPRPTRPAQLAQRPYR